MLFDKAKDLKETSDSSPEDYWNARTGCVIKLLEALAALELGVQGLPARDDDLKAYAAWWCEQMRNAISYYSLDVRLIISILPRGAAMNRNR